MFLIKNPDIQYQEYIRINNLFISKCGTEYLNVISDMLDQKKETIDYVKLRHADINNTILDYSIY